jgi:hypothetical protein
MLSGSSRRGYETDFLRCVYVNLLFSVERSVLVFVRFSSRHHIHIMDLILNVVLICGVIRMPQSVLHSVRDRFSNPLCLFTGP